MFPDMLAEDRRRRGFTVGQVAWRLGVSPREYRELEAGTSFPTLDTWDRICKLYGWSQSFVGRASGEKLRQVASRRPSRRIP
jgi:DNA-binding XRE family transcriptional regulator